MDVLIGQVDKLQNHRHDFSYTGKTAASGSSFGTYWAGNGGSSPFVTGEISGNARSGSETRPANICVIYWERCQ